MTFKNSFEDWLYYEVKSWLLFYPLQEFKDKESFLLYVRKFIRNKYYGYEKKANKDKSQVDIDDKVERFLETYSYDEYCQFLENLYKEING